MVLDVRVGCGATGGNGVGAGSSVRAATVSVVPPAWARVGLMRVEQDERVCSPAVVPAGRRARSVMTSLFDRVGVGVGYFAVRTAGGVVIAGLGVGAAVRIWP